MDQSAKALNLASRMQSEAELLMGALRRLVALREEKERGGVDFTAAPVLAALAGSSLKHTDGERLNNVLSSTTALKTFMDEQFHSDVFDSLRS